MRLVVYPTPSSIPEDIVAIIDVLRFTSSAAYALANGARSIIPCETLDDARSTIHHPPSTIHHLASTICLAGERNAVRPPGFDFGNSPLEFTRDAVQGRDIAWTTTNGTRAIALATGGLTESPVPPSPTPTRPPAPNPRTHLPRTRDLILASYVNLSAVASLLESFLREDASVAVVCAGREGGFALEDAACAGHLVNTLRARLGDALTMNDGARASACIDEAYGEDIPRLFRDAQHGRFLRDHGCGADLEACGALDALPVVPRRRDGRFVAR